MAKGYWIVRVDVSDTAGYQEYVAAKALRDGRSEADLLIMRDVMDRNQRNTG